MKIEYKVFYKELKNQNKIQYLSSKRVKNKRECEKIQLTSDFMDKENNFNPRNGKKDHQNNMKFVLQVFDASEIFSNLIEFIQKYNKGLVDFCILILEVINVVCQNKDICA